MSLEQKQLRKADPSTIQNKFLVGYQGWFTCAGDGEPVGPGHHGWLHWFNYPIPDGGRPNTDLWPDVSDYSPSELYPAPGLTTKTGDQCYLFSSRNPKTVQRHFHWMARHGVDGAFLQRFAGQCDLESPGNEGIFHIRDEVGACVRQAAEREGRVFAIMYDVSGVAPDRIQGIIERDWIHLVRKKGILDSPNYLREKGRAVVALWGFGFAGSNHNPSVVRAIIGYLRKMTPGGVYIVGGAPTHWRSSVQDADPNPEFVDVWLNSFDAISPWTIGRYSTEDEADRFAEEKMKRDMDLIKNANEKSGGVKKIDYIPVVFPGGSGYNLSEGEWGFNNIKRNGGRFFWSQIHNARRHGARIIYGAMWDEYDEGTAIMPVVPYKSQLPVSDQYDFLALDADGSDLPPDWYMRICGFASEGLRGERMIHETFPQKELQDYWATRPRYDDKANAEEPSATGVGGSQQASGSGQAQAVPEENPDEPPPPPYTLEDDVTTPAPAPQNVPQAVPDSVPSTSGPPPLPARSPTVVSRPSSFTPAPAVAQNYEINLVSDMNRHSLTPSPSVRPPPLPPRSTSPRRNASSRPPPSRHHSSLSCEGPKMPSMPVFPGPESESQYSNSFPSGSSYDPYAAWSQPMPPLPNRLRPASPPTNSYQGAASSSYDPYNDRRRVQSSAATFGPPVFHSSYGAPTNELNFPEAFGSGSQPGSNYGQEPYLPEPAHPQGPRNPYEPYPPSQPQESHYSAYQQYSSAQEQYLPQGHSTSPGMGPSSGYTPSYAHTYGGQQAPYPPSPPLSGPQSPYFGNGPGLSHSQSFISPATSPYSGSGTNLSYSQSASSGKKPAGGALGMAKGSVDMLLGKQARKSVQTSVQSVLQPFKKR